MANGEKLKKVPLKTTCSADCYLTGFVFDKCIYLNEGNNPNEPTQACEHPEEKEKPRGGDCSNAVYSSGAKK